MAGLLKRAQYATLARRANERLRSLERAGMYTYARKLAIADIERVRGVGKRRFSTSLRGLSEYQIEMRFAEVQSFLNAQTSTVGGEKRRLNKIVESLNANPKIGIHIDDSEKQQFFDFFTSEIGQELLAFDSERTLMELDDALFSGQNLQHLFELYDDYKNRKDKNIFDAWDEWTAYEPDSENSND